MEYTIRKRVQHLEFKAAELYDEYARLLREDPSSDRIADILRKLEKIHFQLDEIKAFRKWNEK